MCSSASSKEWILWCGRRVHQCKQRAVEESNRSKKSSLRSPSSTLELRCNSMPIAYLPVFNVSYLFAAYRHFLVQTSIPLPQPLCLIHSTPMLPFLCPNHQKVCTFLFSCVSYETKASSSVFFHIIE